jgi:ABC-type phosphate/phosphonate transport system substrate-binding protein
MPAKNTAWRCWGGTTVLALLPLIQLGWLRAEDPPKPLTIGTSGTLSPGAGEAREKSALETLKNFIKDETGLSNEIVRQKDWQELAEKMARKDIPIGVFQGYEFAWAHSEHSNLKPLMLASSGSTYVEAYVVTNRESQAANLAGLQGQSFGRPSTGNPFAWFYIQRQTQAHGKQPDAFFSKIVTEDNVEDALDDVVDGKVGATAVDRAGLEAYKRRKPGRFGKLKEVAASGKALPAIIAYADGALPEKTQERFRNGLLKAKDQDRGQTLLTLFRLTGFEVPPGDFDTILKQTLKNYPPPEKGK